MLSGGARPAGDVVDELQDVGRISQPAVSQHLAVLRDAGLVTVRPEGTSRVYALDPDGLQPALAWLVGLADPLASFEQPLDALETEVARGRHERRVVGRQTTAARRDVDDAVG